MMLEVADIRSTPGRQAGFEEAIEGPGRDLRQIFRDTPEDHTVGCRGGPLCAQRRAIVGPFFASPPVVEHFTLLGRSE